MSVEKKELSREELESEDATALPDREAMSTLPDANAALPVDAAAAANVLSPDAQAGAAATQSSAIGQSLDGVATATSDQTSAIGQGEGDGDAVATPPAEEG
jgi:hypothetical protein